MSRIRFAPSRVVAVALLLAPTALARPAPHGEAPPDFQRDVLPLLADRCFLCHGPDESTRKRGLRLDTADGARALLKSGRHAIVPGDLAKSEMARRIAGDDERRVMPPADFPRPLAESERALLLRWIEAGADYATHWAFAPPQRVEPAVPDAATRQRIDAWSRDPLDAHVFARLAQEGLAPAPEADRATWLRRASFALNGLPPTPEELASFAADGAPDAYEKQVDRLLASPRYGERLAADWLDVARYADTFGYQSDWECRTFAWRDWLIDAFQRDLPYDQFITEQLAGDLLPDATRAQRLATAFNRLHRQTNEGGSIDEEFRQEHLADRVTTYGTAFLGLTLECARCHDHKYDPIAQVDFARLTAFFGAIDEAGSYPYATGATPRPALRLPTAEQEAELARRSAAVAAAEADHARAVAAAQASARERFAAELAAAGAAPPTLVVPPPTRHEPLDGGAPGPSGNATALDGDRGPSFGDWKPFRRCDPLSIRLHLSCPDTKARATVLHTSHFTIESDQQGVQLLIEEGRLSWQVLHLWPGSAAAIRTIEPFPLGRFVDVVATYDGSSRAAGLALYFDGERVATEVVRDHLDGPTPWRTLQIGFRDRDLGLAGGAADELQLFDRELCALEVAELHAPGRFAAQRAELLAADAPALRALAAAQDGEVARTFAALRAARAAEQELLESLPEIMVMEASAHPRPTYPLLRGAYDAPDRTRPLQPDAALPALLPFDPSWPRDRLGLARWTTSPANPLAARVAVNRLVALCFGRGLVPTQENFGTQGERPLHQPLLDALAVDFVESGWRVKALLRRLVLSATFRQSSHADAAKLASDPNNQLLSRGPAVRLSAEMVRDQALLAAGLLVEKVGGPSAKPWQPPGLWEEAGATGSYQPDSGDGAHRRSLYTFRKRTAPPPNLLLFDAGSREQCLARRQPTQTPLQQLVLWNDAVYVEAARALAHRVATEADGRGPERVDATLARAWLRLTARAPTAGELAALRALHETQLARFTADRAAAAALLQVADPATADPAQAALVLCCSTMLACDAVTRVR
ncbi:MAG: DUF1553 domain-containing protein [Planctomycetes bacterium]|nr:DUF1553 domain-containing protein [Planctomycetota bacterium]